jgi:hypothetical protein
MPRGMPIVRSVGRCASSHAEIVGSGTPRQNVAGNASAAVSGAVEPSGASSCGACAQNVAQAAAGCVAAAARTQSKRSLASDAGTSGDTARLSARATSSGSRTCMIAA